jgi:ABC-type hemin transport system ATPase subunit
MRDGRVLTSGPKPAVLTAERLSELFDASVTVDEEGGYFYARPT